MFFSKNSPYACQRTREQTQANAGADASESGGRDERVWEQMRPNLGVETNASRSGDERVCPQIR